jgi:hypothetical protein
MLSSIFALLCPPVGLADQLVDVLAAWIGVDDRCPGLPAVHGMGREYVELGEVNARPVVGEFGGWVAELSLKFIASEVDVEPEHARPVEVGVLIEPSHVAYDDRRKRSHPVGPDIEEAVAPVALWGAVLGSGLQKLHVR